MRAGCSDSFTILVSIQELEDMKASPQTRNVLVAGLAFLAIALGNAAESRADTVADFTSAGNKDYTYTSTSTMATLSSTPAYPSGLKGTVTFGPTFFQPVGGYAGLISLTAKSSDKVSSGQEDGFNGSYTIYNNTLNPIGGVAPGGALIMVSFTDASLTVSAQGTSASLGNLLPDATVTITSYLSGSAPIAQPESFSLSLSGVNLPSTTTTPPGVQTNSNGFFKSFTGNDTNTASAMVTPEPSTMALAGLGTLGFVVYGLRRRKALGA
jgi:hypothetical protein